MEEKAYNKKEEILKLLPYAEPFLFVDELVQVSENSITGLYTFKKDASFYQGHLVGNPITPGVLLTECCAQIGLTCFGLYLLLENDEKPQEEYKIAFSHSCMDFLKIVLPGEQVTVIAEKVYFRFNKLKCKVKMWDETGEVVCMGNMSGILIRDNG